MLVYRRYQKDRSVVLYHGDCLDLLRAMPDESVDLTITSPPYCMNRPYDRSRTLEDFTDLHREVLREVIRVTKPTGSICWQVGYYVSRSGAITPLDYLIFRTAVEELGLRLRNRIVWTFGHGLHCARRFSGRHEIVMWFTRQDTYHFNLDAVRVPQKYPGKRSSRGANRGEYSGNPKGKNPEDVWTIPNVSAKHIEKTSHPCQFPVALAQRLVRALSPLSGTVLDPFAGACSTGVAALLDRRKFVGSELRRQYWRIGHKRLLGTLDGTARVRPIDRPILIPPEGSAVSRRPAHFTVGAETV